MATTALRKFLRNITVAFDGKRVFRQAVDYWNRAIRSLRNKARTLATCLERLVVSRSIRRQGHEVAMLGRIEGGKFASMMRTARSVEAFEAATGSKLSLIAKQAFRRVDDVAELHFPDLALMRRARYVSGHRNELIVRRVIKNGDVVSTASTLKNIVLRDASLLSRTNFLSRTVARTKKILFLGGVITATGVGITYLCKKATEHAAENTGCFVYVNDNGTVRRCRAAGCSCPLSYGKDVVGVSACRDEDLWERMRLKRSDCADAAKDHAVGERYCVHCDWDEKDSNSANYVDREALPENAYVRCEHQDALDALNEMIGGTIDSAWDVVNSAGKQARSAFASSMQILPWIFGAIGLIIVASLAVMVWRVWKRINDVAAGTTDNGKDYRHKRD